MDLTELRRRIAAANQRALKPRITTHELVMYKALKAIEQQLLAGRSPLPAQLRRLTASQRKTLKDEVHSAVSAEKFRFDIPANLKRDYEEKQRIADFLFNTQRNADSAYESLMESLQEILDLPHGVTFFDREIDLRPGYEPAFCPEEFPRLVTSGSIHSKYKKRSVREVRNEAAAACIKRMIYDLTHVPSDDSDDPRTLAKLNAFLKVK